MLVTLLFVHANAQFNSKFIFPDMPHPQANPIGADLEKDPDMWQKRRRAFWIQSYHIYENMCLKSGSDKSSYFTFKTALGLDEMIFYQKTIRECKAICDAFDECWSFEWRPDDAKLGKDNCHISSATVNMTTMPYSNYKLENCAQEGWSYYEKKCPHSKNPPQGYVGWAGRCQEGHNDVTYDFPISLTQCAQKCDLDPKCETFEWRWRWDKFAIKIGDEGSNWKAVSNAQCQLSYCTVEDCAMAWDCGSHHWSIYQKVGDNELGNQVRYNKYMADNGRELYWKYKEIKDTYDDEHAKYDGAVALLESAIRLCTMPWNGQFFYECVPPPLWNLPGFTVSDEMLAAAELPRGPLVNVKDVKTGDGQMGIDCPNVPMAWWEGAGELTMTLVLLRSIW